MNTIELLKKRGWMVKESSENNLDFPEEIKKRYLNIPINLLSFTKYFTYFLAPNEQSWFLTLLDYNGKSDSAYAWNEWEVESLNAASGDLDWQKEIQSFWNNHLPFFISVKDGYSYLAISQEDGAVVFGEEPEFEETVKIADSFDSFIELLVENPEEFSRFI